VGAQVRLVKPRRRAVAAPHRREKPCATDARARYNASMPAFDAVLAQALQLPEEERGDLVARLLRSLEPDDGDEVTGDDWEGAWSAEIDRRVEEVRNGTADLVDGETVLRESRAWLDSQRR